MQVRFLHNENSTLIKTQKNTYFLILNGTNQADIYKIPTYSHQVYANFLSTHICIETSYFTFVSHPFIETHAIESINHKYNNYKPLFFDRFKYVGKGFKLIYKKKKKLFNCIFGYSHIYWVKLQNTLVRKTRKYKFMFITKNDQTFSIFIQILKKIKPINRYTLRGVRTYTHAWVKRKGRKSVATHI